MFVLLLSFFVLLHFIIILFEIISVMEKENFVLFFNYKAP